MFQVEVKVAPCWLACELVGVGSAPSCALVVTVHFEGQIERPEREADIFIPSRKHNLDILSTKSHPTGPKPNTRFSLVPESTWQCRVIPGDITSHPPSQAPTKNAVSVSITAVDGSLLMTPRQVGFPLVEYSTSPRSRTWNELIICIVLYLQR